MPIARSIIIGNLGADPDVKNGVCNVRIAVSEKWTDKNGDRKEVTHWIPVVMFGKQVDIATKYLKKGMLVLVEGRLRSNEWEKNGEKRRDLQVVCDNFQMLGSKGDSGSSNAKQSPAPRQKPPAVPDMNDDIPF